MAGVGTGLACLQLGPELVVVLWLVATVISGLVFVLELQPPAASRDTGAGPAGAGSVWSVVGARSSAYGVLSTGACGFTVLRPGLTVVLVLAAAATSPALRSRARSTVSARSLRVTRAGPSWSEPPPLVGRHPVGPAATTPAAPRPGMPRDPVSARGLSTEELCHTWRRTSLLLQQHNDASAAATVVSIRQACLQELERRDPAGVREWLSSGSRATGSPERYLDTSTGSGPSDVV